jgi:hypothetical protein
MQSFFFDVTEQLLFVLITISFLSVFANGDGACKTDNINRMITLPVITLSGFDCANHEITNYLNNHLNNI